MSFMGWLFYLCGKIHWHPLICSLSGPHSQSGSFSEEKKPLPCIENQNKVPRRSSHSVVTVPTVLPSLHRFFKNRGSETKLKTKKFEFRKHAL
jgi:hypothetical protein